MNKILKWKEVWFQFNVCAISSDLCERVILEEGFWVNKCLLKKILLRYMETLTCAIQIADFFFKLKICSNRLPEYRE